MIHQLIAVSPIDGRYHGKTKELGNYFSEYGLIKYRVKTEVEYFIALFTIAKLPALNDLAQSIMAEDQIRSIIQEFSVKDAKRIKAIEKKINHDVKAVEYFVKEKIEDLGFGKFKEFVHFGLTSQDVTNTALPGMFRDSLNKVYDQLFINVLEKMFNLFDSCNIPMLAHTHGQPATPTTMKKELRVFFERINDQYLLLAQIPHKGKFGGASGNLNAHKVAYPEINWQKFAEEFLSEKLGLVRERFTTQISTYDALADQFHVLMRINTILLDMCRDIWTYISMGYFTQKVVKGEVGSSAMPHKVNPIDFENAEGNLIIANALFEVLARELPVSRLQRDLCDSTMTRNIGSPLAHTVIALKSISKGLGKIEINKEKIDHDLYYNWAVVSEAIQTILRREQYPKPYEALKELTRGNKQVTEKRLSEFIDTLDVPEPVKDELKQITPWNYLGYAAE